MTITLNFSAVLAAGAGLTALSTLLLLSTWRAAGRPAFLAAWAGCGGLAVIAILLHAFRDRLPAALLILVATPVFAVAMTLFWVGGRRLRGVPAPLWAFALPQVAWYAACAVPAFYASESARLLLGTLLFGGLGTAGGIEVLRLPGSAALRRAAWPLGVLALAMGLLPLWRIGQILLGEPVVFSGAGYLLGVLLHVAIGFAGVALTSVQAAERDAGLIAAAARREAAALAAGRAEIERLLTSLPAIIFLREVAADGSSRRRYIAGDVAQVTGWSAEQLSPQGDRVGGFMIAPPGTTPQDAFDAALRRTMRDGELKLDWQQRQPDGALRWMRSHMRRLSRTPDGGGEVVGATFDVSAEYAATAAAAAAREGAAALLRESEGRWHGLFARMQEGVALCEMVPGAAGEAADFRYLEVNAAWQGLTGLAAADVVGRRATEAIPGLERFWIDTYARVVETGEPAHVEYRAAALDRWFEVMAYRTEPGRFAALFLNITDRKRAEQRQALLAREVDHRAKNALAVVQSVLRLTRAADLPGFIRAVEGRVAALGRAQSLLASTRWDGADLRALLEGELAPFRGGQRVTLEGPPVTLPAVAAQPLAMAVHELATNAVKHGALSVPGGALAVRWSLTANGAPKLHLRWVETGGPAVAGAPARSGFGSRVLEGTVHGQLGGRVGLAWEAAGLVCALEIPLMPSPDLAATAGAAEPAVLDVAAV